MVVFACLCGPRFGDRTERKRSAEVLGSMCWVLRNALTCKENLFKWLSSTVDELNRTAVTLQV